MLQFRETKPFQGVPATVEVFKVGRWKHERYGTFEITLEDLQTIVRNFQASEKSIPLDFDHLSATGSTPEARRSAGWCHDLRIENDRLLANVALTTEAAAWVKGGQYRYISGEWHPDYVSKVTGERIGPVLLAIGLVNRPFLEGLEPVHVMSEKPIRFVERGPSPDVARAFAALEAPADSTSPTVRALRAAEVLGGVHMLGEALNGDAVLREEVLNDRSGESDLLPSEIIEVRATRLRLSDDPRLGAKRLSKYEALGRVLAADFQLADRYRRQVTGGLKPDPETARILSERSRKSDTTPPGEGETPDAVAELLRRAADLVAQGVCVTAHQAMITTLERDADLAKRYREATVAGVKQS